MSTHKLQAEFNNTFFCTITCNRWLPLILEAEAHDTVYRWFSYLHEKDKCLVAACVIMPNHIHLLLHYRNESKSLNKIVGEGKRFMAYDIIKKLKNSEKKLLLDKLSADVSPTARAKGKKHEVFTLSFDARLCYSIKMIEQKLDYIHHNPVSGKWNLIKDYADYEHSSAGFYENGVHRYFKVVHYKDLGHY